MIYREVQRRLRVPAAQGLNRAQLVLFRALLEKSRREHDGAWVARYGDAQLMRHTGYQRTTVVELRRQLEQAGLIATVEGSGLSLTRYEILEEAIAHVPV